MHMTSLVHVLSTLIQIIMEMANLELPVTSNNLQIFKLHLLFSCNCKPNSKTMSESALGKKMVNQNMIRILVQRLLEVARYRAMMMRNVLLFSGTGLHNVKNGLVITMRSMGMVMLNNNASSRSNSLKKLQ